MQLDHSTYRLAGDDKVGRVFLWIAVIGLAAGIVGLVVNPARFFRSYLVADVFWVSLGLGALFFVIMHHLTGSVWSVVLRRIPEAMAATMPIMALTFIPVLAGLGDLYPWTRQETLVELTSSPTKSFYLSPVFFIVRTVIYFVILIWMARALYRASLRQDQAPDVDALPTFRLYSARAVLPFSFITVWAAFDWLMSLVPGWYSTIFGVAFFCSSAAGTLSLIALSAIFLNRAGVLSKEITGEHYYDLGKLIFAFIIMWAYMGFSQYLLIWYSNIPEEVDWYRMRTGPWQPVSLLLPFGQFVVPFIALMSQSAKRNLRTMTFVGIWLLAMHWVNLYWYVLPDFRQTIAFSWMDVALTAGLGGLFLWRFWHKLATQPLVPIGDPYLEESVNFVSEY